MSREKILKEISANKPDALPLPGSFVPEAVAVDVAMQFEKVLTSIGGIVKFVESRQEVIDFFNERSGAGLQIVQGIESMDGYNGNGYLQKTGLELEAVDLVLLTGVLGVAENGSIWVPERRMINRLLPFICQQLVLVISRSSIVPTMHHAYEKIRVDEDGYGVFIAGPSKTADIEQSLVIGAHGPLGLMVFVTED